MAPQERMSDQEKHFLREAARMNRDALLGDFNARSGADAYEFRTIEVDLEGESPFPEQDEERHAHNAAVSTQMGGSPAHSSLIKRADHVVDGHGGNDAENEKKNDFFTHLILQQHFEEQRKAFNAYIEELNRIAAELRLRIGENKTHLGKNTDWIEGMERRHEGAAPAITYYEENGHFERDEDGALKNKEVQALLDAYILRMNKTPGNYSDTAIAIMIQRQMEFEREEAARLEQENAGLEEKISEDERLLKEVEKEAELAVEKRNDLERLYKKNPELAQQEIDKFWKDVRERDYGGFKGADVLDRASINNPDNDILKDEIYRAKMNTDANSALPMVESYLNEDGLGGAFAMAAAESAQPESNSESSVDIQKNNTEPPKPG